MLPDLATGSEIRQLFMLNYDKEIERIVLWILATFFTIIVTLINDSGYFFC